MSLGSSTGFGVALAIAAVVGTGCNATDHGAPTRASASRPAISVTRSPTTAAPVETTVPPSSSLAPEPACRVGDLTISAGEQGQAMQQPFLAVIVTNNRESSCALRGYPKVAMIGNTVASTGTLTGPTHRFRERVSHGIYERQDPGPHRVSLQPHHSALFYVGTDIGAGAHLVVIHQILVGLGRGPASLALTLRSHGMPADLEPAQPLGVGITAFQTAP